jgi:hypothetical protein
MLYGGPRLQMPKGDAFGYDPDTGTSISCRCLGTANHAYRSRPEDMQRDRNVSYCKVGFPLLRLKRLEGDFCSASDCPHISIAYA